MNRILRAGLLLGLAVGSCGLAANRGPRWCVFYGADAPAHSFDGFSLVVLDSDRHPPLKTLLQRQCVVLGYLSLGEVENYRSFYSEVKAEGILLSENKNWKGSYFVDLRDARWGDRVITAIIPGILSQGFHGVFLDTLDNPAELERVDPNKYAGLTRAAAELTKKIRRAFPETKIMMNRGYEILPQVEREIDYELGESVIATYDSEQRKYRWIPKADSAIQIDLLRSARERAPKLKIFTLDYWDPADPASIQSIYRMERENGFEPYVATIGLARVVRKP